MNLADRLAAARESRGDADLEQDVLPDAYEARADSVAPVYRNRPSEGRWKLTTEKLHQRIDGTYFVHGFSTERRGLLAAPSIIVTSGSRRSCA